jgi:hypothetical protein
MMSTAATAASGLRHDIAADTVVSVMLADGWHRVALGSLVISPIGFGPGADFGVPGFRFAEADAGSPYQPTMLAGPLNSIIAVRLVSPSRARPTSRDRTGPTYDGHTADECRPQPVGASR